MSLVKYLFILILICLTFLAKASHNRAGEIIYVQTGELTIEATVITYTKSSSIQADRDSILISWGDGTSEYILRSNGNGQTLGNNTQKNLYIKSHTYPGRNTYTMKMTDPNRVAEIQNLNFPNSENIKFTLVTTFTFTNSNFNGLNNSVVLLRDPIDFACVGKTFIHIPDAYDQDGDSIVFELAVPLEENCEPVDDYQLPNEIIPTNNDFSFSTVDGTIIWETPQKAGEYNVTFYVHEFRDGVLLNSMLRDMQIFVLNCNNDPPNIEVPEEICVIAGETVEFTISVTDPDIGQQVAVDATGGPFQISPNTASFQAPIGYSDVPFTATFKWETRCEDISESPYQVVFRAVDNFFVTDTVSGLADLQSVKIKVVGPPPENLIAASNNSSIELMWDMPYSCEVTEDMFFQGFSVWRHQGPIDIPLDTCDPGIEGKGYVEISFPSINIVNGLYQYVDTDVEKGRTYCYRVVAEFAKLSSTGNPFNFVQGLVSNEVCLQLPQDIPLLTEVSVLLTDPNFGMIQTRWIKPDPVQLDTIMNPGPYRYQLQRADGINGNNFIDVNGATFSSTFFNEDIDTAFLEENLNTENQAYNYRVAFYSNGVENLFDYSPTSSSVFLNIFSTDELNILQWDANTSWINSLYYIYLQDPVTSNFDLIDSTNNQFYENEGLVNGEEYCYVVESVGSYEVAGLPDSLYNLSNESCGIPLDTIPPCIPELTVSNICEEATNDTEEYLFVNTLLWERVDLSCENSDDLASYNIYYKASTQDEFQFLQVVTDIQIISIEHKPENGLTACYAITSVDSVGNESALSSIICIDDCPSYILPNAFTPNLDGSNDLFIPILNRFVSRIQFDVYNEWGQKVFKTEDPQILWNGQNFQGNQLNDGVYYYTCEVFQLNSVGEERTYDFLKGYIQILKSE